MVAKEKKSVAKVGLAGMIAGGLEICITYPLEFAKTAAQLEGGWAVTHTGFQQGTLSYLLQTVRTRGFLGMYTGATPWFVFAGPRSAVRFASFEESKRYIPNDFVCGLIAGSIESALLNTPNQAIQIKLVHDTKGELSKGGFLRSLGAIYRRFGLWDGFFCGMAPAILKGAVTNGIRFFGYHIIVGNEKPSLFMSMAAGGTAGAISAVISQPIDTVKANMMGLDARQYRNSLDCCAAIIRTDGVLALWKGVGPRTARVFLEVGLQFTFFEQIFTLVNKLL